MVQDDQDGRQPETLEEWRDLARKHIHKSTELGRELFDRQQRLEQTEARFQEMLAAEHNLSNAYIRLRVILDAMNAPAGKVWEHTEARARDLVSEQNGAKERLASVLVMAQEMVDKLGSMGYWQELERIAPTWASDFLAVLSGPQNAAMQVRAYYAAELMHEVNRLQGLRGVVQDERDRAIATAERLSERVATAEALAASALAALHAVEWGGRANFATACPACHLQWSWASPKHKPDCIVGNTLANPDASTLLARSRADAAVVAAVHEYVTWWEGKEFNGIESADRWKVVLQALAARRALDSKPEEGATST